MKYIIIHSEFSHMLFGRIKVFEYSTLKPIMISASEAHSF